MSAPRFRLLHSSLAVRDLDVAVGFYRDAFAAEEVFEEREIGDLIQRTLGLSEVRCDLAQLRLPGTPQLVELIAFRDVPSGGEDRVPVRVGHGHVCFAVEDLELALTHVEGLGAQRIGEVVAYPDGRAIYLREPGGSVFELEERVLA